MQIPEIQYAQSGDLQLAYTRYGEGPDVVIIPPLVSNVELSWEQELYRRVLEHDARYVRVLEFDKRGGGCSDRFERHPTLEERIGDIHAVMDAEGVARAHLLRLSEGGLMAQLFAATHPERVDRLVLVNSHPGASAWRQLRPYERPDDEQVALPLQHRAPRRRDARPHRGLRVAERDAPVDAPHGRSRTGRRLLPGRLGWPPRPQPRRHCTVITVTPPACTAGSYSAPGTGPCTPCPAGTFADSPGRTACTPCSTCGAAEYQTSTCAAVADTECDAGDASCPACDGPTVADCTSCPSAEPPVGGVCGPGCSLAPAEGCRQPILGGKSKLDVKDGADDTKDSLKWRWLKGEATSVADFGDPLTGDGWLLCIYDAGVRVSSTELPAGETCGIKPCWSAKPTGFTYKDNELTPEGACLAVSSCSWRRADSVRYSHPCHGV